MILSGKAHEIVAEKKQLAETANSIYAEYFAPTETMGHPLSFYRWLAIPGHHDAFQLEADLGRQGIRVFHSDRFLSGPSMPNKFLRIGLSSAQSFDELRRGFGILKQCLE